MSGLNKKENPKPQNPLKYDIEIEISDALLPSCWKVLDEMSEL